MSHGVQDPTETALGIISYMSPDVPGFSGVLKGRFSDFVVHEAGVDGAIARLDSLEPVAKNDMAAKVVIEAADEPEPASKKQKVETETPPDWTVLEKELEEIIGDSNVAKETVGLLQQEKAEEDKKFVVQPTLPDKDARRTLHAWIRQKLASCARADTHEGRVRIWPIQFEREMPNYNKFVRKSPKPAKPQPPPHCKYLQFVLYKENMETGAAISQIQRMVGGGNHFRGGRRRPRHDNNIRMGYAGMKDKRGITSQFITVPSSTSISQLALANRGSGGRGHTRGMGGRGIIRIGNFEYVANELRLGRLAGNRFDIALRNIQMDEDSSSSVTVAKDQLEQAVDALAKGGFINYFGVQRFGKFHDTHLTGFCVLKGDYEGAVDIIMSPKTGERENVAEARQAWKDRFTTAEMQTEDKKAKAEQECAKNIIREFGMFMQSECAVLNSLARHPLDYKKAFGCIGKTMRMMFVHAVQSYLWNHVVSRRIDQMGRAVLEGDLVLAEAVAGADKQSGIPAVKTVSKDDVTAGTYSLEHVVMPLIGAKTQLPSNESGSIFDEILKEKGITRQAMCEISERDHNAAGDYRKILCLPSDVECEVLKYSDPQQPLLQTDLMLMETIDIAKDNDTESSKFVGMRISFTLPSSAYATICLRETMKRPTSSEYQATLSLDNATKPE